MAHNIEELRERFRCLLDNLCDKYGLGEYVDGRHPEDIDCEWEGYNDAADHYGIWTGSGATKFVIGDDNFDYVIKICPQPEYFDYCAREVEVYEEAVRAGYADRFAWCAKLFDYDFNDSFNLPVYVMEWCQCSYDMIDDEMDDWHYTRYCSSHNLNKDDDAFEKYCSEGRNDRDYQERMMEWVYSVWGMDYSNTDDYAFCVFMRKMFINDIHAGNWGWLNNKLVLVDYSGYGDNLSHRSIYY